MSDNSPPVSYNSAPIWKLGLTCEYVNQIENQLRPRGQKRCFTLWIKLCWIVSLKLGFTCEIYKQIQNQSSSCSKALLDFVNENYIGLRFWSLATHVINNYRINRGFVFKSVGSLVNKTYVGLRVWRVVSHMNKKCNINVIIVLFFSQVYFAFAVCVLNLFFNTAHETRKIKLNMSVQ